MIRPEIDSGCRLIGKTDAKCPYCTSTKPKSLTKSNTSVYLNHIRLKKIHTRYFAVCTDCKKAFEVEK